MNQIDLNNKTAVITGGAQGFGYSMVERFSQSGAKVVIWDKDQELIDSLDLLKMLAQYKQMLLHTIVLKSQYKRP